MIRRIAWYLIRIGKELAKFRPDYNSGEIRVTDTARYEDLLKRIIEGYDDSTIGKTW